MLGRPSTDPRDILQRGVGKCQEFSILFTAACISVGYDARTAAIVDMHFWNTPHAFLYVNLNGFWVEVDSSARAPDRLVVNDTSVYTNWSWFPGVGKEYYVFDFNANKAYNVTSNFLGLET